MLYFYWCFKFSVTPISQNIMNSKSAFGYGHLLTWNMYHYIHCTKDGVNRPTEFVNMNYSITDYIHCNDAVKQVHWACKHHLLKEDEAYLTKMAARIPGGSQRCSDKSSCSPQTYHWASIKHKPQHWVAVVANRWDNSHKEIKIRTWICRTWYWNIHGRYMLANELFTGEARDKLKRMNIKL